MKGLVTESRSAFIYRVKLEQSVSSNTNLKPVSLFRFFLRDRTEDAFRLQEFQKM